MPSRVVSAQEVAETFYTSLKEWSHKLNQKPKLVALLANNDPASVKYAESSRKTFDEFGIDFELQRAYRGWKCRRCLHLILRNEWDATFTMNSRVKTDVSGLTLLNDANVLLWTIDHHGSRCSRLNEENKARLVLVCRALLSSLKRVTLSYMHLVLESHLYMIMWVRQMKRLQVEVLLYIETMHEIRRKPGESEMLDTFLRFLIIFSDSTHWKTIANTDAIKDALRKLASNLVGHMVLHRLHPTLKQLLYRSVADLESASLAAAVSLSLRPLSCVQYNNENLTLSLLINILSVPTLVYQLGNRSQAGLTLLIKSEIFTSAMFLLKSVQTMRILFNALEGNYTLCLIGNLLDLASRVEIRANVPSMSDSSTLETLMDILSRLFTHCGLYIRSHSGNSITHHPIFGWFAGTTEPALSSLFPVLITQLKLLWKLPTIIGLFGELLTDSYFNDDDDKHEAARRSLKKRASIAQRGDISTASSKVASIDAVLTIRVREACSLLLTVMITLPKQRTEILSTISYGSNVLPCLWRFLNSIRRTGVSKLIPPDEYMVPVFTLFAEACVHLILVLDDHDIYDLRCPFSPETFAKMACFFNDLVFYLLWEGPQLSGGSDELQMFSLLLSASRDLVLSLHSRHCRRSLTSNSTPCTPDDLFVIKSFSQLEIEKEIRAKRPRAFTILRDIPHVIPFARRVRMFRDAIEDNKRTVGSSELRKLLKIHRNRLLEDGYSKISKLSVTDVKGTIRVQFINEHGLPEAGIDQDGVFKEFLEEVCKAAFNPQFGLFQMTSDHRIYPSVTSRFHSNHLELFNFVGRMLGKAVYDGIVLDIPFAHFFLSKLQGRYPFTDELASLDADLAKNLLFLKTYEGDASDLGLTFSIDTDILGHIEHVELVPLGDTTPVTNANKILYVHLMADYHMNRQLRDQTAAFIAGFRSMIDDAWLCAFAPSELQRLISGDAASFDVNDLRRYTKYAGGYYNNHRVIRWLWQIIGDEFNDDERGKFLKFVTSCSKAPVLGFSALTPAFTVRLVMPDEDHRDFDTPLSIFKGFFSIGGDMDRLPTASTCFNLLKLPPYKQKKTLREKIRYAIIDTRAGFELA